MLKNQNENHENSKHQISNIKWFDKPFDRLTVLSKIEGLITLSQPVESLWVERQAPADQVSGRMEVSVFSVPRCRFASDGIFDRFQLPCFFFLTPDPPPAEHLKSCTPNIAKGKKINYQSLGPMKSVFALTQKA